MTEDAIPSMAEEQSAAPTRVRRILRAAADRMRRAATGLADVMMPPLCLSCRCPLASHDALCAECWSKITFIRPPLCDVLGVPLPFGGPGRIVSAAAAADPPAYDRARAVAQYDGVMRELIQDFKFRDKQDARGLFARWLIGAGAELLEGADAVLPVPLSRWRLIWRRFNQAAMLSQDVARMSGKLYLPQTLDRVRRTKSQVGLTRAERRLNVHGAFAVRAADEDAIRGKNIVLIDDIITTGATVDAAAKALKRAGARRVEVLALAIVADTSHAAF